MLTLFCLQMLMIELQLHSRDSRWHTKITIWLPMPLSCHTLGLNIDKNGPKQCCSFWCWITAYMQRVHVLFLLESSFYFASTTFIAFYHVFALIAWQTYNTAHPKLNRLKHPWWIDDLSCFLTRDQHISESGFAIIL